MVGTFIIFLFPHRHRTQQGIEGEGGLINTHRVLLGGFLVTQGVYTGVEDFKDKIVRHLMVRVSGWISPEALNIVLTWDISVD